MTFLSNLIKKILGDSNSKNIKKYLAKVNLINELEADIKKLTDEALKSKTVEFKKRYQNNETLNDLLPEAFAVVREASFRVLGMRHFDVQLIGGIVMHDGCIAEMKTGEGKTLMSTLAAYLNALSEEGVYVVTVNDYLAKRDSEWMGEIFEFLGLSVGLISSELEPEDRVKQYQSDIVYGTNNEFAFDYLRDNLAWDPAVISQKRRSFAIIDEIDSILIDEARTPLIISGPVKDDPKLFKDMLKVINKLAEEEDFIIEEKHKNITLTESGIKKVEKVLNIEDIYSVENMEKAHVLIQSLKAKYLFKNEIDYVVKDGDVQIVDEFTGRILDGRRFSDGLHQAIEAKENVKIRSESQTFASVTYQNYFRMFSKLSGMTGTAKTEEEEFISIYNLSVVAVPTNKPMIRDDSADVIYKNEEQKFNAIVREIKSCQETGQPVLVGTISIENSEKISSLLKKEKIDHQILNAKYHEKEAEIIGQAGQKGKVTISTNMAGRGTDIKLGEGVLELGGLYVIGSERHESRRIDNQLRGRSGRQGDIGKSKFFVSLQDDLMRLFGSDRIENIMNRLGMPDDMPIEHKLISRSIQKAQNKVEQYHFGIRKQILQFDDVMDQQRNTIYSLRNDILTNQNMNNRVKEMLSTLFTQFYAEYIKDSQEIDKDLEAFDKVLIKTFNVETNFDEYKANYKNTDFVEKLVERFYDYYIQKRNEVSPAIFDEFVTKHVFMNLLDRKWMDHLHSMDTLRDGIGLRAYGQRDPLTEYKKEGYDMFQDLIFSIYLESFEIISHVKIKITNTATGG